MSTYKNSKIFNKLKDLNTFSELEIHNIVYVFLDAALKNHQIVELVFEQTLKEIINKKN